MSKTTTNNSKKGSNEVKFCNEIFSNISLREIAKVGMWSESEIDDLFKEAHHKPQLNTLCKELKIALTTFYLALPYEGKIKRVYSEKIRRFKWENQSKWNKEVKMFDDGDLQIEYMQLKAAKQKLLNEVAECKQNTLARIKSALLFQTYEHYRKLQAHKNCDDYEIYKDLYKVAIANYLKVNGVKPSIQLVNYLCDDTNINGVNKNINADDINIKCASTYEKYVINFTYSMVQALIDYKVINCESYLHNKLFANSLADIDAKSDLLLLQDIAEMDN